MDVGSILDRSNSSRSSDSSISFNSSNDFSQEYASRVGKGEED